MASGFLRCCSFLHACMMCSTLDTASLNSIFESYNYTDFSSPPVPSGFTPSSSRHTSLSRLSQSSRTTRTLRAGGAQSLTRCCSRSHQRKFQQISTGERKKKKGGKGKKKKNNHSPLGVYSLGRAITGQYCYVPLPFVLSRRAECGRARCS